MEYSPLPHCGENEKISVLGFGGIGKTQPEDIAAYFATR